MALAVASRKYSKDYTKWTFEYTEWSYYRGPILQVLNYAILLSTVLVGMSINVIEMQPQNLFHPEAIVFILNGILLAIYMLGSFVTTWKYEKLLPLQLENLLATGVELKLPSLESAKIKPGTLSDIQPSLSSQERHIVQSESNVRLAYDAAGNYLKAHPSEASGKFASGYQIRGYCDNAGNVSYHMLPTEITQTFDTASIMTQSARTHIDADDFEPHVLNVVKSEGLGDMKDSIHIVKASDFNARLAVDPYFLGVAQGNYFKMIVEEDTILLYVFYMLSVWLLTLRCSGTGLQLWLIVFAPPMLYALAPRYRRFYKQENMPTKAEKFVDRRDQWVYVQMLWATVSLSIIGLAYKVFPTLANNDYYITRVAIWQFAQTNDNFWWTGDSGGFTYHTIHTVTILQLAIFSYLAFIGLAIAFKLAMSFCPMRFIGYVANR
jgi:hypothetical protein